MRRLPPALLSCLAALALMACGQTGALYLPDEADAPASAPAAAPEAAPNSADETQDEDEPKQEKEKLGNQELR